MNKNMKVILLVLTIIVLIAGIFVYFKTNSYYINFYSEGTLIQTIKTRKNRPMKEPETPTRDGYIFIGWYDEDGKVFDFDNDITQNMNLSAGWGQITTE